AKAVAGRRTPKCRRADIFGLTPRGAPMTPVKKPKTMAKAKPKTKPKGKPSLPVTLSDKRIELLLEIGSEEIPAGMLPRAIDELKTILERNLVAENLNEGVTVETFGGPRRLTAWVRGLVAKQVDVVNEISARPSLWPTTMSAHRQEPPSASPKSRAWLCTNSSPCRPLRANTWLCGSLVEAAPRTICCSIFCRARFTTLPGHAP